MGFWRFLIRLVGRWYVIVTLVLSLTTFPEDIAKVLGFQWPWPQLPSQAYLVILLAAVVYAAYDVNREEVTEARRESREAALTEGELRFDLDDRYTWTYPFPDKHGRHVLVYGTVRSLGSSAVRLTSISLIDAEGRQYQAIEPPGSIRTIDGSVGIGASHAHFIPSGIFIIEPNRPKDIVALFRTEHEEWRGPVESASYSLTLQDDRGRSVQKEFACRIHHGNRL